MLPNVRNVAFPVCKTLKIFHRVQRDCIRGWWSLSESLSGHPSQFRRPIHLLCCWVLFCVQSVASGRVCNFWPRHKSRVPSDFAPLCPVSVRHYGLRYLSRQNSPLLLPPNRWFRYLLPALYWQNFFVWRRQFSPCHRVPSFRSSWLFPWVMF